MLFDFIGWKHLIVTHYLAKFNGQRFCGNRDITYLICHVTLQYHVIKRFSDFIEGICLLNRTTLSSLVAIAILIVKR